jgi:hypothetical protein
MCRMIGIAGFPNPSLPLPNTGPGEGSRAKGTGAPGYCDRLHVCWLNMAWTPPINRRGNKELLSSKRFFRLLSEQFNFMDPDTTLVFYAGLVALIGDELRKNKIVRLPHIGDLALVTQKARPAWIGKVHAVIGCREVLRFYPKEKLRRYFSKRQGSPLFQEVLPPRAIR